MVLIMNVPLNILYINLACPIFRHTQNGATAAILKDSALSFCALNCNRRSPGTS